MLDEEMAASLPAAVLAMFRIMLDLQRWNLFPPIALDSGPVTASQPYRGPPFFRNMSQTRPDTPRE